MKTAGDFFLAATSFDEQTQRAFQGQFDIRQVLMGLTVALGVGAVIVLGIYLRSRMKSNDQDRERLAQMMRRQDGGSSAGKGSSTVTADGRHRRRKHRRRRDHRKRNPPLSETGGLPPPRPDDQLPKY